MLVVGLTLFGKSVLFIVNLYCKLYCFKYCTDIVSLIIYASFSRACISCMYIVHVYPGSEIISVVVHILFKIYLLCCS